MNWFESLIYGLVSGYSEFLPVSSHAHQSLLLHIFGIHDTDPVRSFVIHSAMLIALILSLRGITDQLLGGKPATRRETASQRSYDLRLVKNAALPLIIGLFVFTYIYKKIDVLPIIVIFLIVNGMILFLPERMMTGSRNARGMTFFDSILIGFSGALSAFSGISSIAAVMLVAHARGADRTKALQWSLMLSVPALICWIIVDFFGIISGAAVFGFWANLIGYILSGVTAFISASLAIRTIRTITERTGYGIFAFYSWGFALLTFLLYLAVV